MNKIKDFLIKRAMICKYNEFCTKCPLYLMAKKYKKKAICYNFDFIAEHADEYIKIIEDYKFEQN